MQYCAIGIAIIKTNDKSYANVGCSEMPATRMTSGIIMLRRNFVRGCIAAMAASPFVNNNRSSSATDTRFTGCTLVDQANAGILHSSFYSGELANSSGDERTDRRLGRFAIRLGNALGVWPGIFFYTGNNISYQQNAFATPQTFINSTTGSIVFGHDLFWDFVSKLDGSDFFSAAILAHEYGHMYQYTGGFGDRSQLSFGQANVKRIELHADLLSGYFLTKYAAKDTQPSKPEISEIVDAWASLGDCNFHSRDHHGSPDERVSAFLKGIEFGRLFGETYTERQKMLNDSVRFVEDNFDGGKNAC